ncbi:structure-specific endonuclease subunit SLX4-like [Ochotona curzoniae]|uniref:structure-specific endonuclease subunit SLX4-like n=1 Tax=Ochotona curzoniae TaxID=130825 RepID=UPI001B34D785|nr:structure-specific endonuclease subunit SLX4-like [Ochotona curzoniae]
MAPSGCKRCMGVFPFLPESAPDSDCRPPPFCSTTATPSSCKTRTAELVLQRMQQFKRVDPERLKHASEECSRGAAPEDRGLKSPGEELTAGHGRPALPATDSDAAMALALQQEFGQEATSACNDSLEEKGLFFCQICQKNLSTMNVVRREQHMNRCLDKAEQAQRPPAPQIPECPICGKPFLTLKSRASHLKQCAVKMQVGPQLLLQAVRLQTAQPEAGGPPPSASIGNPTGGSKRKGTSHRKEPRKRRKVGQPEAPSEDLLVAMALSRSEMEHSPAATALRLESAFSERTRPGAEKKSRKKKPPASPPQLLIQDSETTGRQIEDRVAMLLSEEMEMPSTPQLPASRILKEELRKAAGKQNSLWEGSALTGAWAVESFYTANLVPPIVPQQPTKEPPRPLTPEKPQPDLPGPPDLPSSPGAGHGAGDLSLTTTQREHQALQDLVDLAQEELNTSPEPSRGDLASSGLDVVPCSLPLTGFVLPPKEKHPEGGDHALLSFGLLIADFSTMVNNPHLSDVQFQTDSGEVLYAHKFVLYARCPLLIQYVSSEGFSAMEDGAQGQRVLLSDVSTEAVQAFLRYLYTADTSLSPRLVPDLTSLALRFGVSDLVHLCQQVPTTVESEEEQWAEEDKSCASRVENFQELLKSVWVDGEEEAETPMNPEDGEGDREQVNEAEMEEIYEFAATQRKLLQGQRATAMDEAAQPREESPESAQILASKRVSSVLTLLTQLEHKARGTSTAWDPLASIDLTQSRPEQLSSQALSTPCTRSQESEVILLSDSDEELGLEQAKGMLDAAGSPKERTVSGISSKSAELFSVIDVDADLERSQSPPGGGAESQEEGLCERSDPEDSTTDTSWLVPATPLVSRSHDCSSQSRIVSFRPRTPANERAARTPRARGTAHTFSVIVSQNQAAAHVPATSGASDGGGWGCGSPSRPHARHPKHSSPLGPSRLGGSLPDLAWQFPTCSPPRPLWPLQAEANEVVEVEDSEGEQEAASLQAHSSPLLDREPPVLVDDCSWHAEPLSPIPIDQVNLERTGPLSTSSPCNRAQEAPAYSAGHAPGLLVTPPTHGRRSPQTSLPASSPGNSRPSFLNSALWDDWDGGEQRSPKALPAARTPGANGAQRSATSEMPKGANRKKNLPPKVPITPMPRYSIMETPVLRKELDRFGVRPLPKRQMVLKLKEIFQYTHQTLESDSEDEIQASEMPLATPLSQSHSTETSKPAGAEGCGVLGPGQPAGPEGDTRLPASQESVDSSDSSFSSQSSSSAEFGAALESAGDEEQGISASQAAMPAADVEEAVRRYIRSTPALHRKVLLYQPLELAELQTELRQNGIRVAMGKLLDILDAHCITFTTAAARKEKLNRKRLQRVGKKKGGQK